MVCLCVVALVSGILLAVVWLCRKIKIFFTTPDVPELEDTWWGSGDPIKEDKTIQPFEVNVPEEVS